jgi:hypothetical protein
LPQLEPIQASAIIDACDFRLIRDVMPLLRFREPTSVLKPRHNTSADAKTASPKQILQKTWERPTKEMPE